MGPVSRRKLSLRSSYIQNRKAVGAPGPDSDLLRILLPGSKLVLQRGLTMEIEIKPSVSLKSVSASSQKGTNKTRDPNKHA